MSEHLAAVSEKIGPNVSAGTKADPQDRKCTQSVEILLLLDVYFSLGFSTVASSTTGDNLVIKPRY